MGPGTDLFEVVERCWVTSSSVIGAKEHGGRGGGSSGSDTGTSLGTIGKKHKERTSQRLVWLMVRVPSSLRSRGILFTLQPWQNWVFGSQAGWNRYYWQVWQMWYVPHPVLGPLTPQSRDGWGKINNRWNPWKLPLLLHILSCLFSICSLVAKSHGPLDNAV